MRLIALSVSLKHFAKRSKGVDTIPLHSSLQLGPPDRLDDEIHVHAGKPFFGKKYGDNTDPDFFSCVNCR
jgi:hypothetical protein